MVKSSFENIFLTLPPFKFSRLKEKWWNVEPWLFVDMQEPKNSPGWTEAYLALQDELERERALAGEVGVALEVVDAGLQHPRLVENRETWRFVVQAGDEVVGAVRPELHLWGRRGWRKNGKVKRNFLHQDDFL